MIKFDISAKELFILLEIKEDAPVDFTFSGISHIDNVKNDTIIFIKDLDDIAIKKIRDYKNVFVITQTTNASPIWHITVSNTRLTMAKVLNYLANRTCLSKGISPNAFVSAGSFIHESVIVEPFAFIDDKVIIGKNTIVKFGAKILKNTSIGENCIIRENSVVGGQGFGVEKDEDGNNYKIAHLGGVSIGNFVEIGALNTIVSGTIEPTTIKDYVKIDDHVHIAHNCHIGVNCIITAGVILSGSVTIGDNVWVGPNSTVKNSIRINNNNLIGIGTLVTKDINETNLTYAGNPALEFSKLISDKKKIEYILHNFEKFKSLLGD